MGDRLAGIVGALFHQRRRAALAIAALLFVITQVSATTLASQLSIAATPGWIKKDMTVSEFFATCPANFGTKPIESVSEDFSRGLLCYEHFLSLSNYLEETKQICPKLTYETQDVKNIVKLEVKFYKLLLVQVARAKRKNPSTKYQDVVMPMLQKRYPC